MTRYQHTTDDYTLGKGIVAFNRLKSAVYQGFRDLGDTPAFTVNIALEMLDHFSSRAGLAAKDKQVVKSATPGFAFTCNNINVENMELMALGLITSVVQLASDGAKTTHTVVELDRWYIDADTGKRKWKPPTYLKYDGGTGLFVAGEVVYGAGGAYAKVGAVIGNATAGILVIHHVTGTFVNNEALTGSVAGVAVADGAQVVKAAGDVLVCNGTGTTVYTLTTDYDLDLDAGRVLPISTGAIVAGTLVVGYAAEKCTYRRVSFLADSQIEGQLHFISDNAEGENYELIFWRASLKPNGDTAFIGDGWSTIQFTGEILKDETNHASDPYGFIIESPTVVATTTT